MIIFTGNFLNEAKLRQPITIIHDFNEATSVAVCSTHELSEVEKAVELHNRVVLPLQFKAYAQKGNIQYCKPTTEQESAIRGIDLTFVRRIIKKIPENGSLIFDKIINIPLLFYFNIS